MSEQSDLINVPKRVTKYANVYPHGWGGFHDNLKKASNWRGITCLGIVAMHFEDGKFAGAEKVDEPLPEEGTNHG